MYVAVLVTVLPLAVCNFIVYWAVLVKKLATFVPPTFAVRVTVPEVPLAIDTGLASCQTVVFPSTFPEFMVTVAEPVF